MAMINTFSPPRPRRSPGCSSNGLAKRQADTARHRFRCCRRSRRHHSGVGLRRPDGRLVHRPDRRPACSASSCTTVKPCLRCDDALDCFGVHWCRRHRRRDAHRRVRDPALRRHRPGLHDRQNRRLRHGDPADRRRSRRSLTHHRVVASRLCRSCSRSSMWSSGCASPAEAEREGLDLTVHGERAYTCRPSGRGGTRHRPLRRGPGSKGPGSPFLGSFFHSRAKNGRNSRWLIGS